MRIKVLVADDHKVMRDLLRAIVQKQDDMEVVGEAANGKEVIEMAKQSRPDVIIMDAIMPEMTGIEATRAIKSDCPDIVVIALSIHSDRRYRTAMSAAGAQAYLLKDTAFGQLAQTIRAALSRGKQNQIR
ncbi:MAG: response regulator transcription factor [bacterium]